MREATRAVGFKRRFRTNERSNTDRVRSELFKLFILSTFAWSTIGHIAGIAAIVAFVAAGAMIVLVGLGIIHRRKLTTN
jgi:hypothetical protein